MRQILLILLVVFVGALALGPMFLGTKKQAARNLVILSPHWDGIRVEFAKAFERHWLKQHQEQIHVDFWDIGGTGQIRRFIQERTAGKRFEQGEGIGVDLIFGGGTFDYRGFQRSGLLEPYLPKPTRDGKIPAVVNGQPLRDQGNHWHAACLSGFGLVYNRLVIEKAGLPAPQTWEDLASPAYLDWVSCGDPTRSGSLHMAFEIVLQAYGFEKGWRVLARLSANVPAFNEGGGSVPRDVSLGQAAAGPCIDFYAAAPVRRQGADHLVFVFPQGLSVITPDAMALVKNAPNRDLAEAFIDYVLSEEGQRLWYQKRGSTGGPNEFDLERLPVWPTLYDQHLPTHTVARPFEEGNAFAYNDAKGGKRWRILEDLFQAVLIDVHADLRQAWIAIIKNNRVADLGPLLGQSPVNETELLEVRNKRLPPSEMNALRRKWTGWARSHYRNIAAKARQP